jgi:GH25 family lysozyme M1 (1,4-beta-N-acetylmuramidase)
MKLRERPWRDAPAEIGCAAFRRSRPAARWEEGIRMPSFKGIDVSKYQGRIHWAGVKSAGMKFAMIRAGVAQPDGQITLDPMFYSNLKGAAAEGISTGVYVYLLTRTFDAAKRAGGQVVSMVRDWEITYPIAADMEDRIYFSGNREENAAIVQGFLSGVAELDYYPILYTYTAFAKEHLDMEEVSAYPLWLADYRTEPGYDGKYTMWQYSSQGEVEGISTPVDLDESYIDYPVFLREQGKNGLKPPATKWQLNIYSFRTQSRAAEVAEAFRTLDLYCEVRPNGREWRIVMYSFSQRERAEAVSQAIRALGFYNEVQPLG